MTCAVCGGEVRESTISDRMVHVVYPWNLLPPKPWHRVIVEDAA